jgi:hypothetical protein
MLRYDRERKALRRRILGGSLGPHLTVDRERARCVFRAADIEQT